MIADLVIATAAEVSALDLDELIELPFPAVQSKNVESVKLATLQALHEGIDLEDMDAVLALMPPAEIFSDEGVAVLPVAPTLVAAWAQWSDDLLPNLALCWIQTDEMLVDGWDKSETVAYLREVREFLRRPRATDAQVWLYLSP